MELLARLLNDQTMLNLALTYQGDMYCRSGDTLRSVEYLEAARDTTPLADKAARGNGIQLLGRSYLRAKRLGDFERAMREAEEISALLEEDENTLSTHGQYSLGTVYEEYGRTYAILGQTQQAIDYLDKAEQTLSPTKHWEILLKTARSMALVHDGEINEGVKLAVESVELCRKHGTIRLMERIYGVQRYLDKMTKDIGKASSLLRDALYGSVKY
jgi:tetratricopeptide (TPR) repeat protein